MFGVSFGFGRTSDLETDMSSTISPSEASDIDPLLCLF